MGMNLRWMQEIKRFLPVKPQYLLWGNIYDVYPFVNNPLNPPMTLKLGDFLKNSLKEAGNYRLFLEYTPLVGFRLMEGDPEIFQRITSCSISPDLPLHVTLVKSLEIIERLLRSQETHSVMIMNMASRYRLLEREEVLNEFHYRMFSLSHDLSPKMIPALNDQTPLFDPVFWLVDRENEIPDWYTVGNIKVRSISIPKPDFEGRKSIIQALCRNIAGFGELSAEKQKENIGLFVDQSARMFASEIISIVQLARNEKLKFGEIGEAIKRYRVGVIENPWAKLDFDKIKKADMHLNTRVKGQPQAIQKTVDIIRRAVYNLSGSQYSRFSMRPKGVLFFAGPTGVGKTELAKTVTELLFGSENNYLRFDMSEFSHEHSDQRLIGAPPGYVGYDVGGELTNAVKQNPFAVILFDEIEKAHPKILDIFLQILDDGRLTSGRGETVFFTESLIVFTSNLGIYEKLPDGTKIQRVLPEMELPKIQAEVISAIEDFFKYKIARPEILNRIGENIVVFDFIREEIGRKILDRMLDNIKAKLLETHQIMIEISQPAYERIADFCVKDLSMGGRGVGNKIEAAFLNPLSSALFEAGVKAGEKLLVNIDAANKIILQKKSQQQPRAC